MTFVGAMKSFFEALDSPRTADVTATAPTQPPAVQTPAPLGQIVEALQVRVAGLEASVEGMRGFIREETDRAQRASEAGRRAVQRALQRVEGIVPEQDPVEDVSGDDGGGSRARELLPVSRDVEIPAPTPESIRDAARRAVAFQ